MWGRWFFGFLVGGTCCCGDWLLSAVVWLRWSDVPLFDVERNFMIISFFVEM